MDPSTISILIFITGLLIILGIYQLKSAEARQVENRMQWVSTGKVKEKIRRQSENKEEEATEYWRKFLHSAGKIFMARRLGKRMEKRLTEADIPLRGDEFVSITIVSGLGAGFFFTLVTTSIQAGLSALIAAAVIPYLLVRMAYNRRINAFNAQIGDALAIMSNSLRSGFSFLQAMDMVRREMPDPIRKEFSRTFREINLGTSTEDALQNMVERVNSEDMELVITSVLIQRQVGGNLAEVLENIGGTIRERIRIKREIKTITAQGRISGLIIGLLPVVLAAIMFMMNPEYIMMLFNTNAGQMMLLMAIFGELIGILFIKKIVNIEV